MDTDSDFLNWLEPPDHGLDELKGKIRRRATRGKVLAGITTAAVAVVTALAVFYDGVESAAPHAPTEREWQAAISAQEENLRVVNGAALRLSPTNSDTRIYLVSTLQDQGAPGSE